MKPYLFIAVVYFAGHGYWSGQQLSERLEQAKKEGESIGMAKIILSHNIAELTEFRI